MFKINYFVFGINDNITKYNNINPLALETDI